MKRFITLMVMALVSVSAFAQFNDNYRERMTEQTADQYLVDQYMKGQEQMAVGGIVLTTTMVFDAVYYGILVDAARKPHADADQLATASIIGGVVTGVGVIASLWQFASGHANVQKAKSMVHFNESGALCITFPERRVRHRPTPSWER